MYDRRTEMATTIVQKVLDPSSYITYVAFIDLEAMMHSAVQHQSKQDVIAAAIRAWHRGETLTPAQSDLIDAVRREVLLRAHGVVL